MNSIQHIRFTSSISTCESIDTLTEIQLPIGMVFKIGEA